MKWLICSLWFCEEVSCKIFNVWVFSALQHSLGEDGGHSVLARVVPLQQHVLELRVHILNLLVHLLGKQGYWQSHDYILLDIQLFWSYIIWDEEVVSTRDVLHDVPLDLLVLEHRHPVVDQDGRLGCLEVRPEIKHCHNRHNRRKFWVLSLK